MIHQYCLGIPQALIVAVLRARLRPQFGAPSGGSSGAIARATWMQTVAGYAGCSSAGTRCERRDPPITSAFLNGKTRLGLNRLGWALVWRYRLSHRRLLWAKRAHRS